MKMHWRKLGKSWRSLPLVTLALATLWLLCAVVVEFGFAGSLRDADRRLRTAGGFALQHPEVQLSARVLPLAQALMPSFQSNEVFDFLSGKSAEPGGSQDQFDELSEGAFAAANAHPYRLLGLVPAEPRPASFATHVFVHSGIRHVLVNLILLLLAGPLLERLWGRFVFGGALTVWALASAGLFFAVHAGSEHALLGGSALVSACVAALLTRLAREEADFLAWLRPLAEVELSVPVWVLAPVWALGTGIAAWSIPGAFPGIDNAIGWSAQACGALLGAGVALAAQRLRWEERFGAPPPCASELRASEPFDLERVKAQYATEERELALVALQRQVERSPGHRDAVTQWFAWAVEELEPERAVPAMLGLLRHELRRGADDVALAQWAELVDCVPDVEVDVPMWLRLTKVAQRSGQTQTLLTLLQGVVDAAPEADVLAQAALLAAELSPELGLFAARTALSDSELGAGMRTELEALVEFFDPGAGGSALSDEEDKEREESTLPANVFYEESDRSAFGAVDDLNALDNFPQGALSEAVPLALVDAALRADFDSRGVIDVSFARVRAVAMVGVHGLGPKPVLLIDVLLDGSGSERALSVLRLRSDRFDPRRLLDDPPEAALAALCSFVACLLAGSGGVPLPDAQSTEGRPVKVYTSLDDYHEQVLQPAALELD